MKNITTFIALLFSITIFSQINDFNQFNDNVKKLITSKFKSMEILISKNGSLVLDKKYIYQKDINEVVIYDYNENKEKNFLQTNIKIDTTGNVIELKDMFKGEVLEQDKLVTKTYELNKKISYAKDNIQILSYNSKNEISSKEMLLLDDKMRTVESIKMYYAPTDIIISNVTKYKWDNDGLGYNIERLQFSYPKQKLIGHYKLDRHGEIESFKGNLYIDNVQEDASFILDKKTKKFDSKGNLVQIYKDDKKSQLLIEERKIIY